MMNCRIKYESLMYVLSQREMLFHLSSEFLTVFNKIGIRMRFYLFLSRFYLEKWLLHFRIAKLMIICLKKTIWILVNIIQ